MADKTTERGHFQNATLNTTHGTFLRPNQDFLDLLATFSDVMFGSSCFIAAIGVVTILANSFLLFVIYKDPYRKFRSPPTYFLISLSVADLITGLTYEIFVPVCELMRRFGHAGFEVHCRTLIKSGVYVTLITLNVSIFSVLAFTMTQYLVVVSPLRYGRKVTVKKIVFCLILIWFYCVLFTVANWFTVAKFGSETDMLHPVLAKIDHFFHSIFVTILIIVFYVLQFRAFRRKMKDRMNLRTESDSQRWKQEEDRTIRAEHKLLMVNLFLVLVLVICCLPSAIAWLIHLYWFNGVPTLKLGIGQLILNVFLLLKFMLDPFVYAWRLPQYRKAVRKILLGSAAIADRSEVTKSMADTAL